ncbi:MAG: transcriptional regulator Spx, partial [Erysipelotrichaceae bacterium]|nr:transcriptional regulator Spx [Erysipelotrichaceae bacterium]
MIVVYTSPGCSSCRKVKSYLKDNHLEYIEKNIFNTLLNRNEIKYLISRTDNGTDDIISKRSKIIQ